MAKIEELFDCRARGIRQRTYLVDGNFVNFILEGGRSYITIIPTIPTEVEDQQDIVGSLVSYLEDLHNEKLLYRWDERRRVWLILPNPEDI